MDFRVPENRDEAAGAAHERRSRIAHAVKELVAERQEVLVAFWGLAKLDSYADTEAIMDKLRAFCQILVDYTALGHFEIYQRIVEGKERRRAVRSVAEQVYPAIAETTDILVDFNDKYDGVDEADELEGLVHDLSKLGEAFAIRVDLEDRILAALQAPRVQ